MYKGSNRDNRDNRDNSPLKPLKIWIILREDLLYTTDRVVNIVLKGINENFNTLDSLDAREKWVSDGSKFEIFFMFNMDFLYKLEYKLIEDGHIFTWIYDKNTVVGILIGPSDFYFRGTLLQDCMTLKEYSKHRLDQFNELGTLSTSSTMSTA